MGASEEGATTLVSPTLKTLLSIIQSPGRSVPSSPQAGLTWNPRVADRKERKRQLVAIGGPNIIVPAVL